MSAVFRLVLVLLIAVTLPAQVLAGVAMPFCGGQGGTHVATAGESAAIHVDHDSRPGDVGGHAGHVHDAAEHGAAHATHADASADPHAGHAAGGDDPVTMSGGGCDQCGLCQLACASALPVSTTELRCELRSVLQPAPASSSTAFLSDTLLRPPRAASC
jgi:NAD-dependent dihydropyrimidine dehydrogenase PreA subunit